MYAGLTTADKGALERAKENGNICAWKTSDGYMNSSSKYPSWDVGGKVMTIDTALAQIAEMESKQKELLSEKASEKGCLTNRDKWMQLWNESDEILARQFVQQEWYGTQWCVYMFSEEPISRHDKWEDAIQAAITALHSPYTEGETK